MVNTLNSQFTVGHHLYGAWLSLRGVAWAKMRSRQCLPSLRTRVQVANIPSPREYLHKVETHEISVSMSLLGLWQIELDMTASKPGEQSGSQGKDPRLGKESEGVLEGLPGG